MAEEAATLDMEEPDPSVPGEDKRWRSQSVNAESPLPGRVSASSGSSPDRYALLTLVHAHKASLKDGSAI